jgi:glyoxylase-like metal-dependent hydrolase (beta-lactamase superfamily II)
VVDVPTLEGAREIVEESQLLFGRPVSHIFITHGHEDHLDGLPVFLDQNVTIICSERLLDRIPRGKAAVIGVRDRTRVRMGNLEVECQALDGTAHSPWDMVIRVPESRLLCTGDTVVDFSILHFHNADVENWITNLKRLSRADDLFVLPGHGDIYPYTKVAETADFIETLKCAGENCLSGLSPEDISTISEEKVNEIVAAFLDGAQPEAARIRSLAGEGAVRELRMVFRNLLYKKLR